MWATNDTKIIPQGVVVENKASLLCNGYLVGIHHPESFKGWLRMPDAH